ncbi:MAG: ThiF family adenylyltransferase [Actinomycetes bacterium]
MPDAPLDLTAPDGRYNRQELISWWDQSRLAGAQVLVVGAGALGNEIVKNLVLLGVGNVTVIDMDTVENSNLARCVFFREGDEGSLKAEVVARAASQMNPDVTVVSLVGDVRVAMGLGGYRAFDLVIGGLDNREARLHVNRCCWKTGTPWIDGAIEGLMGTMRVFVPPGSACYECTLSDNDFQLLAQRKACSLLSRDDMLAGKVPTTITSASIVAGMQTQEAVKLLHADLVPYEFGGKGVAYNGMTHDTYTVTYPCMDDCLSHDSYDPSMWVPISPRTTVADALGHASALLGSEAVLELEHDVVTNLMCSACNASEPVWRVLPAVASSQALCPTCDGERVPTLVHAIDIGSDDAVLRRELGMLGLPSHDVVTARNGDTRLFFVLQEAA